jgi:hypothetical protein
MPDDQVSTQDIAPVEETDRLDTSEELPRRPRRRVLAPIPLALLGVLLVACGFIGGVLVEKGQAGSSATGASGDLAARLAALRGTTGATGRVSTGTSASGAAFSARFGGSGGTGGVTVGQVSYLEGGTLYVESPEGNTVKVTTSAGSTVTKTVPSSVKGIHPGETVVVQGTANSSGTVAASSISVGGTGGLGRGLGALFGGGGTGGGGARGAKNSGAAGNTTGSSEGPVLFGK